MTAQPRSRLVPTCNGSASEKPTTSTHQQIAVGGYQHLVHHPLQEEWRQRHQGLQRDGQRQQQRQRWPQAIDPPGQLPQAIRMAWPCVA